MLFTQSTAYLIRRDVNLQWQMCILRKKWHYFEWYFVQRGNKFMLCASLANHQKMSRQLLPGRARSHRPALPWVSCSSLTPAGVPPSGLFIVESVLICFIMKNKFAKVYWYAFLYRHIKIQLWCGSRMCCVVYTWLARVYFDFVTCNLLFTMRDFL